MFFFMNENGFLSQFKKCSKCGLPKSLDLFYPKKRGLYGVDSKCKQCVLQTKQEQYKRLKRAKKRVVEITEESEPNLSSESISLMLKYIGVQ